MMPYFLNNDKIYYINMYYTREKTTTGYSTIND